MNDKIKAQFIAQYLGQPMYVHPEYTGDAITLGYKNEICIITLADAVANQHYALLLRTVDMLTDEEVITIANMYGWGDTDITKDRFDERILQFKIDLPCIEIPGYKHRHLKFVFDYLIRIGILLSFTYLNDQNQPVTLSPDEIIEMGWAKIKAS